MNRWQRLVQIAQRQHGFVHVRQADQVGLTADAVRKRADREGWPRPHRGVVGLPGGAATVEARVSAAVLAVGGRVLASRHTAAYLLGITDQAPHVIELVVPYDRGYPRIEGVRVWRSRTLRRRDATTVGGLPVTTAPRTLFDLAAVCSHAELRALVIDALQRRRVSLAALVAVCHRVRSAPGRCRFRQVLLEVDRDRCDSVLAYAVRRGLRAAGLHPDPGPVALPAGDRVLEIDVAFSAFEVGIECDGFAYHSSRAQLDRDTRRRNRVAAYTTWTILHITWDRLERDWAGFLAELRAVLRARGAQYPGA